MDQYVIEFEFAMLYYDMYELIQLMKESNNEELQGYVEELEKIFDEHTP